MAASKQASIHTHVHNAVTLVWGSLRLAPIKTNYCIGDWVSCHQSKFVIILQSLKWNKVTLTFALGSSVVTKILSGTICLYSIVKGWYMYTKLIFRCIASNRHLDWSALMVSFSMLPCTFCSGLPHRACLPFLNAFSSSTIPVKLVSAPQPFCPQSPTVMKHKHGNIASCTNRVE